MHWLKRKLKEERWFPITFAVCSGVLFGFSLYYLNSILELLGSFWSVIAPAFLGVVFGYIMDPIARFFEKRVFKKVKNRRIIRCISVYLSVIVTVIILVLLVLAFIPPIINSITSIVENSDQEIQEVMAFVDKTEKTLNNISLKVFKQEFAFSMDAFAGGEETGNGMMKMLNNNKEDIIEVLKTSAGVGSSFVTIILGFVIAIYYMLYKEKLQDVTKRILMRILRKERYESFTEFCRKCDRILLKYMACDILEGAFVGVSNAIFMFAFGMKYISLVSVVVGVTNLAPTFGPIVGAAFGSFLLMLDNPWHAFWFLVFTLIIQTIDGYILKPKLFGETFGVSPVLILVAIILGGRLFGALGILLAIPASAIAQCFVKDYILKRHE